MKKLAQTVLIILTMVGSLAAQIDNSGKIAPPPRGPDITFAESIIKIRIFFLTFSYNYRIITISIVVK